jgi:hypothetical protein
MSDRRDPTRPSRRHAPRAGGRRATDPPADYVTVGVFAAKYGVSRNTVKKWMRADILLIYRVGPLVRVRDMRPDLHLAVKQAQTGK